MSNYLFETIAETIEKRIALGELAVGSKLPSERSMAESYGVSRNVIREAIRVLGEKGFVEVRAGRGGFVCKPSQQDLSDSLTSVVESSSASVQEIVEAREVFETAILACAAEKADSQDLETLWGLYDQMEQSRTHGKNFALLDREFHMALAQCAKNSVLTLLAGSIYNMADANLFLLTPVNPARIVTAQREHREMILGIERRSAEHIQEAFRRHIACIREQISAEAFTEG